MTKTRLTKRGEPVQGTTIEVSVVHQKGDPESAERTCERVWERCKVVGKGWSKGQDLLIVWLEWEDGGRQPVNWPEIKWRSVSADPQRTPEVTE